MDHLKDDSIFEKNIRKGKYLEKENKISRIYQWKDKKQKTMT